MTTTTPRTGDAPPAGPTADEQEPPERPRRPRAAIAAFVVALCFLAGVVGWRIGRSDPPPADDVSVGFLDDMGYHHQQALVLSFAYLEGDPSDWFLAHTAREIVQQQSYELGIMNDRLQASASTGSPETAMDWMGMKLAPADMPGLASDDDIAALRDARGEEADELFSRLMMLHHAAGIDMADAAAADADDPFVRELAARMAEFQRIEIREMAAERAEQGMPEVDLSTVTHAHLG
jgi:uncharacterized protein (DUF305 family)